MKRRPRTARLVSEINITPFTDVILVLLIIFMIATPLISQANLKVNPIKNQKGKSAPSTSHKSMITINQDGLLFLDKKAVTLEELNDEIDSIHSKDSQAGVILSVDKTAQFRHVSKVLDLLNSLDVKNINVTVEAQR